MKKVGLDCMEFTLIYYLQGLIRLMKCNYQYYLAKIKANYVIVQAILITLRETIHLLCALVYYLQLE